MPVSTNLSKVKYTGSGKGPYAITFSVARDDSNNAEQIGIIVRDSGGTETELTSSYYSVSGLNVYTTVSYDNTNEVVVYRDMNFTQTRDWENSSRLDMDDLTDAIDELYMCLQQIKEEYARNVYIPISDDEATMELPTAADRANNGLYFDASGNVMAGAGITASVSTFMQTVVDDADADTALTTLGFTALARALIDDTDTETMRKTLEIAALPAHYERDEVWAAKTVAAAADRYALMSPSYMTVNINNNGYVLDTQQEIDLSDSDSWDTVGASDVTVAANRAGKDFYIYACEPSSGTTPDIVLSEDSTYPSGYTADSSRKIGGFHCLCVAAGTIAGHTLNGYVAGDILPASVWDLKHRPISDPEGMVFDECSNVWWDIYLASWSSGLQTTYNATIVDGGSTPKLHWYNFVEEFAEVKKRLPTQQEFLSAAIGSPQETNISGSADPGTTGGHSDTASRRIISNIGCEDMTGVLWQWGDGESPSGIAASYAVADTDGTADSLDEDESIGRGQHYLVPYRPRLGGSWADGARCGSRCSVWSASPLALNSGNGARGVAEPKVN